MSYKLTLFTLTLEKFKNNIEDKRFNTKIIKTVYIHTNTLIELKSSGFCLVMIDEIKNSERFKEINIFFPKNAIPFLKKTKMIFSQKTKFIVNTYKLNIENNNFFYKILAEYIKKNIKVSNEKIFIHHFVNYRKFKISEKVTFQEKKNYNETFQEKTKYFEKIIKKLNDNTF